MKTIQIYGKSCEKAETLYVLVKEIVDERQCDAEVKNITDPEVWKHHGALMLPAIAIDDVVVVEGRVPLKHELEIMLERHGIELHDKKDEDDLDVPDHLDDVPKNTDEDNGEPSVPCSDDCSDSDCSCNSSSCCSWSKWLVLLLILIIIVVLVQLFSRMGISTNEDMLQIEGGTALPNEPVAVPSE